MRIDELEWSLERIEHIARHAVTVEEVEEVLSSSPVFKRGKGGVHEAWGKTEAGRYILESFGIWDIIGHGL
jgi:hypothetical protein